MICSELLELCLWLVCDLYVTLDYMHVTGGKCM